MFLPAEFNNVRIIKGADFDLPMTWRDDQGAVFNLTGYTASMKITDGQGSLLIELNTTNNRIVVGAVSPNILCKLAIAEIAGLNFSSPAFYKLYLTAPGAGGLTTLLLFGRATLLP